MNFLIGLQLSALQMTEQLGYLQHSFEYGLQYQAKIMKKLGRIALFSTYHYSRKEHRLRPLLYDTFKTHEEIKITKKLMV